jgi:hypothetical protein
MILIQTKLGGFPKMVIEVVYLGLERTLRSSDINLLKTVPHGALPKRSNYITFELGWRENQ